MKRFLKIISLGLVIWSFSLLWPAINLVLSSWMVLILLTGLSTITLAYFLGLYFGRNYGDYPTPRISHSGPTRPTPVGHIRGHFSRQTSPMPVMASRNPASRPTRPMPIGH
ncbi:MAG TPA: hypothetical protein VEC96_01970 [Anaerolineae bacterium]|nr:hypothetical protein [Anaerolineae bacterium]